MNTRHGLEIRAATAADAPGLSELLRAAGHVIPPHVLAARLDGIRQDAGAILIAVAWGPPAGVVVLHWYRTLDADLLTAEITTLLVGPEERRGGIGRLLIKAAAQAARVAGCGALRLRTAPDDQTLAKFGLATGFTEAGPCFVRPLRKKARGFE